MAKRKPYTLSSFDGKLLDGLTFSRKVYQFFDQIRTAPDGRSRIRLRSTKTEKRLLEELIPIAWYVQARYWAGRRIRVRWFSGSQPFDAMLLSSGPLVEEGLFPKKLLVEVTMSVHPNEHLVRRLVEDRGHAFGAKGTSRNKETGKIESNPHVYKNNERVRDLSNQILESLRKKSAKQYPPGTILIVDCIAGLLEQSEWDDIVEEVKKAGLHRTFREVFLCELIRCVRRRSMERTNNAQSRAPERAMMQSSTVVDSAWWPKCGDGEAQPRRPPTCRYETSLLTRAEQSL